MLEPDSSNPQTVEECNLAMEAIMSKIADQLNFGSKILIQGQEDVLTLSEYEALFAADMKICENALDVVTDLARKQKAYLEAVVAAKRFERSLPSTLANAFKQATVETNNAHDLRKRLKEGDYSFFVSVYAKGDVDVNTAVLSCNTSGQTTKAFVSTITDHLSNATGGVSRSTAFTSSCLGKESSLTSQIRERPKYASDTARRFLNETQPIEKNASIKAEFKTAQQEQNSTKLEPQDYSIGRRHHSVAETINTKQISSSGGCSLDGSLIVDCGESSDQNGLRVYSPVQDIPPQPNFDDTGMDSFCESLAVHSGGFNARKVDDLTANVQERKASSETSSAVLRSTENTAFSKDSNESKPTSGSASKPIWLSSSYQPPRRPKFTSSVGRLFNQE